MLVYVFDHEAPDKLRTARELLFDHLGNDTLALSTQVLAELFRVATSKPEVPLAPRAASAFVEQLAAAHVVRPTTQHVVAATRRSEAAGLSIWDALILEAAEASGAEVLYTEDARLLAAETPLEVRDPFATS